MHTGDTLENPSPPAPTVAYEKSRASRSHNKSGQAILTVIGDDEREAVDNPGIFPYASIALVHGLDKYGTVRNVGTAFMLAPGIAATAAHVVENAAAYGGPDHRAHSIRMWFGYSYGKANGVFAETRDFTVHPSYNRHNYQGIDAASIRIPSCPIAAMKPADLTQLTETQPHWLAGYPASGAGGGRTMIVSGSNSVRHRRELLLHAIDTSEGQSGAPIWVIENGLPYAVAIHNKGTSVSDGMGFQGNGGALLTPALLAWLIS